MSYSLLDWVEIWQIFIPRRLELLKTHHCALHCMKSAIFYFQLLLLCPEHGWQYESEKSFVNVCRLIWLRKVWIWHIGEIFHHSSEKLSPCGISQLDARISCGKFNLLHLEELSWNIQTLGGKQFDIFKWPCNKIGTMGDYEVIFNSSITSGCIRNIGKFDFISSCTDLFN